MEFENGYTECLGRRQLREKMNSNKSLRKNWKRFKNCPYFSKYAFFVTKVSRHQAARSSRQNTQRQNFEKFSKCFSRLEGLPRAEPRKSLSNSCDWTFHSRTNRQNWPANSRLRPVTWLTHDWVAKIGQKWIFEIFKFWEQNTFQKHLKHSKIFLCLN